MRRHTPHSIRRFFVSRSFLLISLGIAILVAVSFARAYYQDRKVRQEIQNLQEEVKHLEKKKFDSLELLKYVSSESFVEEKARTELNLKKKGEHVVFVHDLEAAKGENLGQNQEERKDLSNPLKWWYYFTHKALPN